MAKEFFQFLTFRFYCVSISSGFGFLSAFVSSCKHFERIITLLAPSRHYLFTQLLLLKCSKEFWKIDWDISAQYTPHHFGVLSFTNGTPYRNLSDRDTLSISVCVMIPHGICYINVGIGFNPNVATTIFWPQCNHSLYFKSSVLFVLLSKLCDKAL